MTKLKVVQITPEIMDKLKFLAFMRKTTMKDYIEKMILKDFKESETEIKEYASSF